jgi:hypothetical protein
MADFLRKLWSQEEGQDIAEYAVMLAVILVLVVGRSDWLAGVQTMCFLPPLVRSGNKNPALLWSSSMV